MVVTNFKIYEYENLYIKKSERLEISSLVNYRQLSEKDDPDTISFEDKEL